MSEKTGGLLAGQAAIWAQPYGPNTEPVYLGCHEVGDVEVPEGDVTPTFCPDPAVAGGYRITGSYRGEPGMPTAEIVTPVGATLDYLETWSCPGNILIHKMRSGRRDLFTNYERSFVLYRATRTGKTYGGLASRTPGDEAESLLTVPFSFERLFKPVTLTSGRQTIAETEALNAIDMLNDARCAGFGLAARAASQYGVAAGVAAASATANVYYTQDGGTTWTVCAADPFDKDEDISAVAIIMVGRNTYRLIAARGTTDAGNPAEIAYSDDWGATWRAVNIGSTNAHYIVRANGLFVLDPGHIYAVTDQGYIHVSYDYGASWEQLHNGVAVTSGNGIAFANARIGYVIGDANDFAVTEDAGVTWTAVTGPSVGNALLTLAAVDEQTVWVGDDAGNLWYSHDRGTSWTQRAFAGDGVGEITVVTFVNPMIGFLAHNTAVPVGRVFRTIDGGYHWELISMPTNSGINAGWGGDENQSFFAGNVVAAGTAFAGKVFASA